MQTNQCSWWSGGVVRSSRQAKPQEYGDWLKSSIWQASPVFSCGVTRSLCHSTFFKVCTSTIAIKSLETLLNSMNHNNTFQRVQVYCGYRHSFRARYSYQGVEQTYLIESQYVVYYDSNFKIGGLETVKHLSHPLVILCLS